MQNTFENYAQMANWGVDQSFQIFGNAMADGSPEESMDSK